MLIRDEEERDWFAVHDLNTASFDTPAEALLVDALREQLKPILALVAEEDDIIVGHIFFSPVLHTGKPEVKVMGLAPMAVEVDYRRRGIGAALVRDGIQRCEEAGIAAIVVLGDPTYYSRFGFLPAADYGLHCEFEVPAEAFMAMELQPGSLAGGSGVIKYHPSFSLL